MDQRPRLNEQAPEPVAKFGDAGGDLVGGGRGGYEWTNSDFHAVNEKIDM